MKREDKTIHPRRVALYARVSSDRQAQDGTIDSQVSTIRDRIESDKEVLEPEMTFCDDGVSGTTLVRPALERLRDQAAAGVHRVLSGGRFDAAPGDPARTGLGCQRSWLCGW